MEIDINIITDVDESEAEMLKWLIEFLFEEWYIKKYKTTQRLKELAEL